MSRRPLSVEEKRSKKAAYQREWIRKNPERAKEISKRTYEKNKEKIVRAVVEYKRSNPDKVKVWTATYREKYADKIADYVSRTKDKQAIRSARRYELKKEEMSEYGKTRYEKKKAEILAKNAEWKALNREHVRQQQNAYKRKRLETEPAFRFIELARRRIQNALIGVGSKSARTVELLGCTGEEAVLYLEKLFKPGMSWQNRKEWHIDHIRPLKSFDLKDPEQQRIAFNYTNLQPLWARENRSKAAKY